MPHTILVPLDGSPSAERALEHAIALAKQSMATLHIIRVLPPQRAGVLFRPEGALIDEAKSYLKRMAEQVRHAGLPVETGWRCGDPVEQILCDAIVLDADLIVMATRRYTGFERLLLGSIAEQVVRAAECPVLVVRGNTPATPGTRVLVPLDRSGMGEAIIPFVSRVAQMQCASLVLLHVISEWNAAARAAAKQYLEAQAKSLRDRGLEVETVVSRGEVGKTIVACAKNKQVDLIAMSTHSRPLLERTLFGSVATYALTHASEPVMLYHNHDQVSEPDLSTRTVRSIPTASQC